MPSIEAFAQASYQSDATSLPISIPGAVVNPPNKDQYKATLTLNQLIYDGGVLNTSKDVKNWNLKSEQKQVEIGLHQLKKQVNQLYFSILILHERIELLLEKKEQ